MLRRARGKRVLYYLQHRGGKQTPLGADIGKALDLYRTMNAPSSAGWLAASKAYRESSEYTKLAPVTQAKYKTHLDRLDAVFKTTPLELIRPVALGRIKKEMADRPVAFNRMKATMSAVWKLAREEGLTDAFFPKIKGNSEHASEEYVTDNAFWEVYEHAEQPLRDWMNLSLTSGPRVSDALRIRRKHIQGNKLEVWHSKRRKWVLVDLEADLKTVIDEIMARPVAPIDAIVHDGTGQPLTYDQLRRLFNRAREACGGLPWTLKDIRAKAGTDADTLMEARNLLGHQKPSTTAKHYERRLKARPGRLPAKKSVSNGS